MPPLASKLEISFYVFYRKNNGIPPLVGAGYINYTKENKS